MLTIFNRTGLIHFDWDAGKVRYDESLVMEFDYEALEKIYEEKNPGCDVQLVLLRRKGEIYSTRTTAVPSNYKRDDLPIAYFEISVGADLVLVEDAFRKGLDHIINGDYKEYGSNYDFVNEMKE